MTPAKPLRALIWCAVSSKVQEGEGMLSLPEQERLARAHCVEQGWQVIEPPFRMAHSRNYRNLDDWAASLASKGNDAGLRLFEYWKNRDFDVIVCDTYDRLGRTASMIARVIEETIHSGARIYGVKGGWIDQSNAPAMIAMIGFLATTSMQRMRSLWDPQMDKRAAAGKSVGDIPDLTHVVSRDTSLLGESGKLLINPALRQVWHDAALLFVEDKIAARFIEYELYARFGHINKTTHKPYHPGTFFRLLHTPRFWGHAARHFRFIDGRRKDFPTWAYDESKPVPETVKVWRNVIEPVLSGELAERVKMELARRREIGEGRSAPNTQYALTGLLVCDECGYRLSAHPTKLVGGGVTLYWRCMTRKRVGSKGGSTSQENCTSKNTIRDDVVTRLLRQNVAEILKLPDPRHFFVTGSSDSGERLQQLRQEIDSLEKDADRLVDLQMSMKDAPGAVALYGKRLTDTVEQLAIKRTALTRLELVNEEGHTLQKTRDHALNMLLKEGEAFWENTPARQNQVLHGLMGDWKWSVDVKTKQITGIRKKRKPGSVVE